MKKKIIVTKKKLKRMFQLVHIFLYIYIDKNLSFL